MGRAPCCSKVGLHRGPWTTREDTLLVNYIHTHGEGNWRNMPKQAGLLRCGKSCRLRWMNYLRPDIKRGNITPDEDELIIKLHSLLGNRWSLIAGRLPGRTDNEIKNYWNSHLQKKLKTTSRNPIFTNKSKQTKGPRKKQFNMNTTSTDNSEKQQKESMIINTPKIHVPKPVRASSFIFTRKQSFDSMVSGSPSFGEGDKEGAIDTSQVFNLPWSSHITEGGDHSGSTSFIASGDESHDLAAYISCESPNIMLDQLYEEYQQLLKVEDDAHVNAFVESLLD